MNRFFLLPFKLSLIAATALLFSAPAVQAAEGAPRWQAKADRYLKNDQTNPPPVGGVVFTGSSSIEMWRTLQADFPALPVVNRGIGGTWLADQLQIAPLLVHPLRPRIVVVYAGENDLNAGRSADDVVTAFEQVRSQIHEHAPQARIVFIALKPSPSRVKHFPAMRDANTRIAAACAKDPLCTFVDVFTPMLNEKGEPRGELFIADQLHMNETGYKLWREIVAPVLQRISS